MTSKPLTLSLLVLTLVFMGCTTDAAQTNIHYYAEKEVGYICAETTEVKLTNPKELLALLTRIKSKYDIVTIICIYRRQNDVLPFLITVYYRETAFNFDEFDVPLL